MTPSYPTPFQLVILQNAMVATVRACSPAINSQSLPRCRALGRACNHLSTIATIAATYENTVMVRHDPVPKKRHLLNSRATLTGAAVSLAFYEH